MFSFTGSNSVIFMSHPRFTINCVEMSLDSKLQRANSRSNSVSVNTPFAFADSRGAGSSDFVATCLYGIILSLRYEIVHCAHERMKLLAKLKRLLLHSVSGFSWFFPGYQRKTLF